ncbi:hypothetical protein DJ030_13750 [bacterium endosymbiont of Escarpia laminata]|nr:MAG: hypothetical protein DJ030_13750 [bacterium endosymbiont of Escarpia laminata]
MPDQLKPNFDSSSANPASAAKPEVLKRFNPYDFSDEQITRQATGREALLKRIMAVIRANAQETAPPNQHLLVLGSRGMGKSFLVRMVQVQVQAMTDTKAPVIFVRLPEEQLNVSAPELLLDEIRRMLEGRPAEEVRVRWNAGGEAEWRDALDTLQATLAARAGFGERRGLVVVSIENFDLLLEDVFSNPAAQSRLRDMLASEPRLMLLAAATTPPDKDADERLFQAFQREHMQPWSPDDFVDFYGRAFRGGLRISGEIRAKIRALAQFLGGAPRLAVLMGDILRTNDALSAVETLDQLVDELTPYYQDRILTRLKRNARWLLDEMLRGGEPCSQTELAKRVGADSQADIAQDFRTLQREGVVVGQRETGGRKGLYRVADRVFAHFYRRRYLTNSSHSPLAAMVDFLEGFYNQQELLEQILKLAEQGELEKAGILTWVLQRGEGVWQGVDKWSRARVCLRFVNQVVDASGVQISSALDQTLERLKSLVGVHEPAKALDEARRSVECAQGTVENIQASTAQALTHLIVPMDDEAVRLLQELTGEAEHSESRALYAAVLHSLAMAESFSGASTNADESFKLAAAAAQTVNDECLYASVLRDHLWHLLHTERWNEFFDDFELALEAAEACGDKKNLSTIYRHRAYGHSKKKELDACLRGYERAVNLAAEAEDDIALSLSARNYAWALNKKEKYDEALAAAEQAREVAGRAGDDNLVLHAKWQLLNILMNAERYEEQIKLAPEAIALAHRLDDQETEVNLHWQLADAYEGLGESDRSLDQLREASVLSERTKNYPRSSWLHHLLLQRLTKDTQQHAEEMVDCYLRLCEMQLQKDQDRSAPPRRDFPDFTSAATFSNQWSEVLDSLIRWEARSPDAVKSLPAASSKVGDAIMALYESEGAGPAFSAAAGFLRGVGATMARVDTAQALSGLLSVLIATACTRLIAELDNPGLLRDIAEEVRTRIGNDDIAHGLEAAAQYREQGNKPEALEHVDPDIRTAVSALLELDGVSDREQSAYQGPGYPRADERVTSGERETIAARFTKDAQTWPTPPLYAADWADLDRAQALEAVIATLGAARCASDGRGLDWFLELMGDKDGFGPHTARALLQARAVRLTQPSFYPGWQLVEICVPRSEDSLGTFSCLFGELAVIPILGASPPIHELNARGALALENQRSAADYLRFFCNAVRGDAGPFRIIETEDQLPLAQPLAPESKQELAQHIRPVTLQRDSGTNWIGTALVQYAYGVFAADFEIQSTGMVEMKDDKPVMELEGIRQEKIHSGLRFFDSVFKIEAKQSN